MKAFHSIQLSPVLLALLALAALPLVPTAQAQQNWRAAVGAQSDDKAQQALAFLPTELWIHAGDTITWTAGADEIHTVTFLTATQIYPSFQVGCPGFTPSDSSFDGSTCVSTPPLAKGQTFAVRFPKAGNYKLVCLVHNTMNGTIHVLDSTKRLPHDQDFYDDEAAAQRKALLEDGDHKREMCHHGEGFSAHVLARGNHVIAGVGEISSNPGGTQTSSVVRFLKDTIEIHAGETVEWNNFDPEEPHTITFGVVPANTFAPSSNVTLDADGTRHATISSTHENVHSGFIEATLTDSPGLLPQNPLDFTRFRVTFTEPGTYPYQCVLHDNLGMEGKVIVLP